MWGSCLDKTTDASGVATIKCIPVLITLLINAGFILAGTTALIFIIVGGYKYTMSRGDPKEADGARKTLQFAIVGLIIVLFSAAIVHFLAFITKAPCIVSLSFNCK